MKQKPSKSSPDISVVIPAFNEEKRLPKTLESLKRQRFSGSYEIIVVDNNSTDKTNEIASKYKAVLVKEVKKGVTFARQTGFNKAKAKIIATTDADAILPSNWLQTIHSEFQKNPKAVVVAGQQVFYDAKPILNTLMSIANNTLLRLPYWCIGNNLAIKKEAFNKIGGFNTKLLLFEDQDISNRARKVGKVVKTTKAKVKVSARRYNETGILKGMWYYNNTFLKTRYLGWIYKKTEFIPGSTLKKSNKN